MDFKTFEIPDGVVTVSRLGVDTYQVTIEGTVGEVKFIVNGPAELDKFTQAFEEIYSWMQEREE